MSSNRRFDHPTSTSHSKFVPPSRQEEDVAHSPSEPTRQLNSTSAKSTLTIQRLQNLQRTIGNRRTIRLLNQPETPQVSRTNQETVQRAIGLEFEVPAWHVQHPDGKKLVKGTETVIKQDGVNLTADDDGDRSDIEWVTTALESKDEVLYVMDNAAELAQDMVQHKDTNPLPAKTFSAYGTTHADAQFIPGDKMSAHMQATIGVPLGNIPALYEAMSTATGPQSAYANTTRRRAAAAGLITMKDEAVTVPAPPIPVDQMSAALKGFLMLVIDYLRSGYTANYTVHNQFPKGVLSLMAKTSFKRMLELVQNEAQLTEQDTTTMGLVLKDEWIDWIVQAAIPETTPANVKDERGKRALNHEFGITNAADGKNETPYTVDVTREEWLRNMPQEDMLRLDNPAKLITEKGTGTKMPLSDKLEGFAALNDKTDKLVKDVADQMAQVVVQNVAQVTDTDDAATSGNTLQQPLLEPIMPEKEKAPAKKVSADGKNDPATNAPVFEMRQLEIEGGEPSTWADNALKAWEIYEKAIGDQVYRAGNREDLDGYTENYAETIRPLKQTPTTPQVAQTTAPQPSTQPVTTTATSATNAPLAPAQTGIKAKAKRAWNAFKNLF